MERARYIFNLLVAAFLLLTVAVNRDAKILGEPVKELFSRGESVEGPALVSVDAEGNQVINTAALEENIIGYGGKTPLLISLSNSKIVSVEIGKNSETPEFLEAVTRSGLFDSWDGLTLEQAASHKVDVVSGATFTSEAVIKNVELASAQASGVVAGGNGFDFDISLKSVIALLVIAFGVATTLLKIHNRWVKIALFALNVGVLGFWCGSFLSLSLLISWAANGVNVITSLLPLTLLIVAIVMPLFGRKGTYCAYHCPMGAAQELVSLSSKEKVRIKPEILKVLNKLRNTILALIFILMWAGVGFSIVDYEVFSAFLFESASTAVLVIALLALFLSLFVHRPYCRFVCPTGALLTLIQKTPIKK